MFPFAILAFFTWAGCTQQPKCRYQVFISSFALALATLAKPNFALAFLPVIILTAIYDTAVKRTRRHLVTHLIVATPSILVLAFQFTTSMATGVFSSGRSVLVFDPLVQWGAFTDSFFVSSLRSLLFPLVAIVALYSLRLWSKENRLAAPVPAELTLSWLMVFVATAQFALLSERDVLGNTIFHGNWGWGVFASVLILFISSVKALLSQNSSAIQSDPKVVVPPMAALFVLLGHVASGGVYLWILFVGFGYY
jgi:hypothetical protein